ncbi:uncharacterized protein PV07_06666 [Cladophialophora immunda]|uniref:Uncharacterized protein n=1 Tax=Cladophialophora immunda TaxID=569365 RepID=A0A0D2AP57_9EURO|nr:uncharacterized protein PV07_06666 [Cladophialophora immunda]KIW26872.1 hypothetical protein PV07_06666 [Cladophialophora immunda]
MRLNIYCGSQFFPPTSSHRPSSGISFSFPSTSFAGRVVSLAETGSLQDGNRPSFHSVLVGNIFHMLPRSVRHYLCPPCQIHHGAWTGARIIFEISPARNPRLFCSGSVQRLRNRTRTRKVVQGDVEKNDASIQGNGENGKGKKLHGGPKKSTQRAGAEEQPAEGPAAAQLRSQATGVPKLTAAQKDELHAFSMFRTKMRHIASKLVPEVASRPEDLTLNQVLDGLKLKNRMKGFQRGASRLRSAYPGRSYEDVDNELGVVMPFKSGNKPLSEEAVRILTALGFLDRRRASDAVGLHTEASPAPEMTKDVTTPEPHALIIETPKDLLSPSPKLAPATEDHDEETINAAKSPSRLKQDTTRKHEVIPRDKDKARIAVMKGDNVREAQADAFSLVPLTAEPTNVPRLSHDLSRVLFNPGVYQLQDPRSRVWNFDPYLGTLMPASEFNYEALNKYITSSEDIHLREVALQHTKRYIGSTSSMSGVLSHFHFLLSAFRSLNLENLTRGFKDDGVHFTRLQRGPTAIFLRHKDGVYAVDADKEYDSANILMSLGRSMEKLLTLDKDEFERYRRTKDATKDAQMTATEPEVYHYSGLGEFLLRSQLDAHDPRLPGTGMFDLKTRAVAAVRMMVHNHEVGAGYQIKQRFGTWESYEREYYDMMRSAFLKYSLQVRMGRMDGIFVAYHNTERLFGFQYVPVSELDLALHGQSNRILGDQEFSLSIQLLNDIFNEATMKHPGQSLRFHFEAREATAASPPYMYIFAEPVTEEEIVEIQNLKKEEIRAFEDRLFNPRRTHRDESGEDEDEAELEAQSDDAEFTNESDPPPKPASSSTTVAGPSHRSNAANVAFLDSILGMNINEALGSNSSDGRVSQSGGKPAEGASDFHTSAIERSVAESPITKPFSAWKLNIRNLVNGLPVVRPENLKEGDTWTLQYTLKPLNDHEARRHYGLCKNRRKATLEAPQDADEAASFYIRRLISMSRSGAQWRRHLDKLDAQRKQVVLYGDDR